MKVKCHKCGYEWNYKGRSDNATCPNCLRKTPVPKGTADPPTSKEELDE